MISIGDYVTFDELPGWVSGLAARSQQVFQYCVGRTYPVVEIDDNGLCVLDVSVDVDEKFGGYKNDLRIEAAYLRKVACD